MDIREHKHILLCGDHINPLNILRSIGEEGIRPIVIMQQEGHVSLLAHSKYAGEIIPVHGFDEAMTRLMEYADMECSPFVYTTDDNHLQVLDANYDKLKGKFYFFNAGAQGRVTHYLSKERQCLLAEECGMRAPKSEEVEVGEIPKTLSYPIFTKTDNSYTEGWKRDVYICNNPKELETAYKSMVCKHVLLQEYIKKIGEYSLQGISINGGEQIYMPFEKMFLRFTSTSYGGYMYYQPFKDQELQQKIQKMIQKIGFSGCFEIEFLVDETGKMYFLEINMRFSASNYSVRVGGVNQPYLWAKSTLSGTIDTSDFNLKKERYYIMNETRDIAFAKEVGYWKWFKQLVTADGYYLYNSKDKKPFYNWLWSKMKIAFDIKF